MANAPSLSRILSNKSISKLLKKAYFCSLNEQNQFYEEKYPFCFGTIV